MAGQGSSSWREGCRGKACARKVQGSTRRGCKSQFFPRQRIDRVCRDARRRDYRLRCARRIFFGNKIFIAFDNAGWKATERQTIGSFPIAGVAVSAALWTGIPEELEARHLAEAARERIISLLNEAGVVASGGMPFTTNNSDFVDYRKNRKRPGLGFDGHRSHQSHNRPQATVSNRTDNPTHRDALPVMWSRFAKLLVAFAP